MATHFEYQMGQHVVAQVVERLSVAILVVDINGQLFRVVNQTGQLWRVGEAIPLRVSAINPPEFQIQGRKRGFERFA